MPDKRDLLVALGEGKIAAGALGETLLEVKG